ncbi:unnamed protein product [Paramecium octaurelia]|uniref:Uncharacterized protein n=1 Tax=Paramecium octaurelia TaxID=43137 RepID=A0A8S1YN17_PAROT|nr:unnamed protein product [Paramecium octaurelia]
MLGQYNEATILSRQIIASDPRYSKSICSNLFLILGTQAQFIKIKTFFLSLQFFQKYNETILWADKALQVDRSQCNSQCAKVTYIFQCELRSLKKLIKELKRIQQSLKINSNHFDSLIVKGKGKDLKVTTRSESFEQAIKFIKDFIQLLILIIKILRLKNYFISNDQIEVQKHQGQNENRILFKCFLFFQIILIRFNAQCQIHLKYYYQIPNKKNLLCIKNKKRCAIQNSAITLQHVYDIYYDKILKIFNLDHDLKIN